MMADREARFIIDMAAGCGGRIGLMLRVMFMGEGAATAGGRATGNRLVAGFRFILENRAVNWRWTLAVAFAA